MPNEIHTIAGMSSELPTLPESRQELIDLLTRQASEIEQLTAKVRWFEEQFHLARHKRFGASSERTIKEQGKLFNGARHVRAAAIVDF